MKYFADFQFLPKGQARPSDDGVVVEIETDDNGFMALPNVGDYVQIEAGAEHARFSGRVKSRLFRYFNLENSKSGAINIVIEEVDNEIWGSLIKE